MKEPPRVAVYYAPRPEDPLFAAGATWLGRDPETDAPAPQPELPAIAEVTADARLYGFHATLKPPIRLAPGKLWVELLEAARGIADRIAPFELPALRIRPRALRCRYWPMRASSTSIRFVRRPRTRNWPVAAEVD